jgi:hypothetical protein
MEAICSSVTSVDTHLTIRRDIPSKGVTAVAFILGVPDRFSVGAPAPLTEGFRDFPLLKANAGIVTRVGPQPLPATSLPNHYSLIAQPFEVTSLWPELLSASCRSSQTFRSNLLPASSESKSEPNKQPAKQAC